MKSARLRVFRNEEARTVVAAKVQARSLGGLGFSGVRGGKKAETHHCVPEAMEGEARV